MPPQGESPSLPETGALLDLFAEGSLRPARHLTTVRKRALVEYVVLKRGQIDHSSLEWCSADLLNNPTDLCVPHGGKPVRYEDLPIYVLTALVREGVEWIGRPTSDAPPLCSPRTLLADRRCERYLRAGPQPLEGRRDTVAPLFLSDSGAAKVLREWAEEPVVLTWQRSEGPSAELKGLLQAAGSTDPTLMTLEVQAAGHGPAYQPLAAGDVLSLALGALDRVYNRARDSNLVRVGESWDYRPTLASTYSTVPLSRDANIPFTQDDVDAIVTLVHADLADQVGIGAAEIVERLVDGGLGGHYDFGATGYWLIHKKPVLDDFEVERVEDYVSEKRYQQLRAGARPTQREFELFVEEAMNWDAGTWDVPLLIYELRHREGPVVLIAVSTSTWNSWEGGPQWFSYDEALYLSGEETLEAYEKVGEIEQVL